MAEKKTNRAERTRVTQAVNDVALDDRFLDALTEAARDPGARQRLKSNPKTLLKGAAAGVNVEYLEEEGTWGVRVSSKGDTASAAVEFRATGTADAAAPQDRERFKRETRAIEQAVTSDAVLDATDAALADEQVNSALKADPKGFLKSKGVNLPDGVSVKVTAKSNPMHCWEVCWGWWIFRTCVSCCEYWY